MKRSFLLASAAAILVGIGVLAWWTMRARQPAPATRDFTFIAHPTAGLLRFDRISGSAEVLNPNTNSWVRLDANPSADFDPDAFLASAQPGRP